MSNYKVWLCVYYLKLALLCSPPPPQKKNPMAPMPKQRSHSMSGERETNNTDWQTDKQTDRLTNRHTYKTNKGGHTHIWHRSSNMQALGRGGWDAERAKSSVLKSKVVKVYVRATWPPGLCGSPTICSHNRHVIVKMDLDLVPLSWGGHAPPQWGVSIRLLTVLMRLSWILIEFHHRISYYHSALPLKLDCLISHQDAQFVFICIII